MTLNEQLTAIYEWLCCNKLSLNVLKTHYMIFTPRNKKVNDINLHINKVPIGRVYVTKFLGVQIDSQLNLKKHIEYTCKKLSKCIGILSKARRKLQKSSLISLYYSFAFPYFIYCNHVWGSTYQTNLNNVVLVQKKLIRIITCSPLRAHTEPLMLANRLMSLSNTICIWHVYLCINAWMDVSLIYLMISTPVTETYMVVKHAKRVIYMSHMEGLTLDKTAWKYTEQICGTQFQNMLKCQSLYTYSNKDCVIFY